MLPALINKNPLIPLMIDGKLIGIDYNHIPKALPMHEDIIELETECMDGSILKRSIKKPLLIIIGIGDFDIIPNPTPPSAEIPDVIMVIISTKFSKEKGDSQQTIDIDHEEINDDLENTESSNEPGESTESSNSDSPVNWEDLIDGTVDEETKELMEYLNPNGVADEMTTSGGFSVDITKNKQSENETIAAFVNYVRRKNTKKTVKQVSSIIDSKKAVIEMILRPHKILDHKKTKKKRPLIYALIDSYDSYYNDSGKFLNSFAETCLALGVQTWRANKLTNDYYLEDNPDNILIGNHSHLEWAEFAQVKKGSLILLVGDGCLGGTSGKNIWSEDKLKGFSEKYNPYWIHHFSKNDSCGCSPKPMAMNSNWNFYYGVQKVKDLLKYIEE